MTEITNKIYYVGVNDRNKHRFEGLWPLPNGVSYNSYIIDDEKVTLVDTVEVDFFTQFLENIHEVIGDREIDYLIINHMEPDHSGSIALIKKYYPNIKIVGNKKTLGMLEGFYGVTDDVVEVKNGETLSLGNHELSFVLIPMVHWPETMVTLDAKNKVLFSGDAFGCFGALNGGIIDTEINCETFWLEMVRYYSNICILLSMFLRGKTVSQFRIAAVTREAREFGMILVGGAPSFGRQGLQSIGGMLLNIAARSYGDAAVAGMSIISRIFMFIISVAIGVGQGLQPVAAFNYGARKFRRVQKAAVFTIGAAFCMLVVLVSLCWVNSDALIRLFRDDPEVTAVALPAFHYQCLAILLQPVIVVANMTFQSVGKAGRATFLACCRQGVFFIPLILILPRTFGLVGVEICQPIADALTFIVSLPFLLAFLKQLDRMDDAEKAKAQS